MKLRVKLPLAFSSATLLVAAAALLGISGLNRSLAVYGTTVQAHAADERAVAAMLFAFKMQV